jgi:hypothetical protein
MFIAKYTEYIKYIASIFTASTIALIATPIYATTAELQAAYCTQNWTAAHAIAIKYRDRAQESDPVAAAQWQAYAAHMLKYANGTLSPSTEEITAMGCTTSTVTDTTGLADQNCGITTADGRQVSLDFCNQPASANPAPSNSSSTTSTPAYTGNCRYSWQLDAAGRRCGKRAADQKPGGY